MHDRLFRDTNVLVYAELQDDRLKHDQGVSFIASLKGSPVFISMQVASELYVSLLKHALDDSAIVKTLKQIAATFNIISISLDTVLSAWELKRNSHYSYWDSLILASVLESGSRILYTEDLQHAKIIEKNIKIINPFKDEGVAYAVPGIAPVFPVFFVSLCEISSLNSFVNGWIFVAL